MNKQPLRLFLLVIRDKLWICLLTCPPQLVRIDQKNSQLVQIGKNSRPMLPLDSISEFLKFDRKTAFASVR